MYLTSRSQFFNVQKSSLYIHIYHRIILTLNQFFFSMHNPLPFFFLNYWSNSLHNLLSILLWVSPLHTLTTVTLQHQPFQHLHTVHFLILPYSLPSINVYHLCRHSILLNRHHYVDVSLHLKMEVFQVQVTILPTPNHYQLAALPVILISIPYIQNGLSSPW